MATRRFCLARAGERYVREHVKLACYVKTGLMFLTAKESYKHDQKVTPSAAVVLGFPQQKTLLPPSDLGSALRGLSKSSRRIPKTNPNASASDRAAYGWVVT